MEEEKNNKLYYSIGEVAGMFNVTTSLIRYWESEFKHIRPKTNNKGDRRYRQKEIDDIKVIYNLLKEKGYTIQGAKDFIYSKKPSKAEQLTENLIKLRDFLIELRSKLGPGLTPQ